MIQNRYIIFILLGTLVILSSNCILQAQPITSPSPKDTCPVCGMFVHLYPDWTASAISENGNTYFFDGAKDMFKFILNPEKWAPQIKDNKFADFQVTDYYTLQTLDARKAFYVIGSDVMGPMGNELIPLQTQEDALEFMNDHKGIKILTFGKITGKLLDQLDDNNFQ